MQRVLHLKTKVLAGGRIEIVDPELLVGESPRRDCARPVRDAASVGG